MARVAAEIAAVRHEHLATRAMYSAGSDGVTELRRNVTKAQHIRMKAEQALRQK
jgi:hypothetical protein